MALSASVLLEDRAAAIEAGMDGFATKPVELAQLLSEMGRVTGCVATTVAPTTEPVVSDAWPLDPELVDQPRALQRWGQRELYRQALVRFAHEHTRWLADSQWQAPLSMVEACLSEVHRLKGVAGNLGLTRLAAVCEPLEHALRMSELAEVRQQWKTLREVLTQTVGALVEGLRAAMPEVPDAALVLANPSQHVFTDIVLAQQVMDGLRRGESMEAELEALLANLSACGARMAELDQVRSAIDNFELDEAATLLQRAVTQVCGQSAVLN